MKKLTALLLCLVIVFSFAACAGHEVDDPVEVLPTAEESTASTVAETPSEPVTQGGSGASAVKALEEKYSGLKEDQLDWSFDPDSGTLTITGEGPMRDYSEDVPAWDIHLEQIEKIVIGDEVTSIGATAFCGYPLNCDVHLGAAVEYIDRCAFYYSNIWTINFPDGLKYIGEYAFNNAMLHSSTGFRLPDELLYVGDKAFHSAMKEGEVSLPASLSYIGEEAFSNMFVSAFNVDEHNPSYCSADGVLYDKERKTLICYPADKQDALFEIPETVTEIRSGVIEATYTLEKIVIPAGVEKIEEGAIFWNYALTSIDVDENNKNYKSVDGVLYTADGKTLLCYPIDCGRTAYTVLDGCEKLGAYSMSSATQLEVLFVPEGVKTLGSTALFSCADLVQVSLPKSLAEIEDNNFIYCDSLGCINYAGNNEGWKRIVIGQENDNLSTGAVQIICAE